MGKKITIAVGKTDYPAPATEKALLKLGRQWRKNARISLRKQGKVNTGKLYNSMKPRWDRISTVCMLRLRQKFRIGVLWI